ncbi:hypothetical protein BB559_000912 [Furculomyces boomerangus]|uniref:Uncharacterized protein n=2 Tax=Harpellales TaxID=61421 RepID=A0A2T9Z3Q8_9FUNG|nr:hypothetical protein BB559_000912 [Furculomyces boomerangus]PVZ96806.1 hypothetical protein BB558_007285 [Smittium angustum]PVZ98315.1 hypothetical protein BB558_005685 [Smittium angustum]
MSLLSRRIFNKIAKPNSLVRFSHSASEQPAIIDQGKWWKYTLGAMVTIVAFDQFDSFFTKDGKTHPITNLISSYMRNPEDDRRTLIESEKNIKKISEYVILQKEDAIKRIPLRVANPLYDEFIPYANKPVTKHVDMSGLDQFTTIRR